MIKKKRSPFNNISSASNWVSGSIKGMDKIQKKKKPKKDQIW